MSKTATATPPPQPYFPQRTTTPTMRHNSTPNHQHYVHHHPSHHKTTRRKTKNLPNSGSQSQAGVPSEGKLGEGGKESGLGLSFEDVSTSVTVGPESRTSGSVSAVSMDDERKSPNLTHISDESPAQNESASTKNVSDLPSSGIVTEKTSTENPDESMEIIEPVSMSTEEFDSAPKLISTSANPTIAQRSWVPSFGKVAKAVTSGVGVFIGDRRKPVLDGSKSTSSMGISSGYAPAVDEGTEGKEKRLPDGIAPPHSVSQASKFVLPATSASASAFATPLPSGSTVRSDSGQTDSTGSTGSIGHNERPMSEAEKSRMADYKRVHECARLCSQWPQSVYNMTKYGPNGCPGFYQPQSWSNPTHVASTMAKQAELEKQLCLSSAMFFSCRRTPRSPSTCASNSTEDDTESDQSSQTNSNTHSHTNSPRGSLNLSQASACASVDSLGTKNESGDTDTDTSLSSSMPRRSQIGIEEREKKTREDIRLAMCSSIIPSRSTETDTAEYSPVLTSSPRSLKEARSLTELNHLAISNKDDSMDVDDEPYSSATKLTTPTRPVRAQSCGAKRPLITPDEEDKRRKVDDEAMVVEEAVDTGVILPLPSACSKGMSASTPNLPPASNVFGHVVKTSSTHPIIISPFFPGDLLPVISAHLVVPEQLEDPMMLSSKIDVPSLLLSTIPTDRSPTRKHHSAPSSSQSSFSSFIPSIPGSDITGNGNGNGNGLARTVGNLLLSSCPGKRLRMEGPVKGRGPVCRDLKVDLERIKAEGVGCLVCCLDDTELALLGVPWETYREVAADLELDVIRLPMPDGFTPVSMSLFDSQVGLIATKYTLRGINVLIHCRGGVGRAGLTACAWAIKMGYVQPHPSLVIMEEAARRRSQSQGVAKTQAQTQAQVSQDQGPINGDLTSSWVSSISRAESEPTPSSSSTLFDGITPSNLASTVAPGGENGIPAELEHQIVMSIAERVIAMIRSRRGLKAIESFEQVQFLVRYTAWLRSVAGRS